MTSEYLADPWRARAMADAAMERAASELRGIVKALATSLDPFPGFEGLETVRAIEIDPGVSTDPDRGCVVVVPEGELCEMILRMIPGTPEMNYVDQVEEMRELELEPAEYVAYAHLAVKELARIHEERAPS